MSTILNITNGDSAVDIMQRAGIDGVFLPWRDVLHDGPVPQNLSLQELSLVRAQFIAERGWGAPDAIRQGFVDRDNELRSYRKYRKVILWFEHDLYDQLQILQILDWIHSNPADEVELSIICTDNYLGMLTPEQMKALKRYQQPVTQSHLDISCSAWRAFRSSTPDAWYGLLQHDTSALPFLKGAIVRMLEEYPACDHGLSRTAHQALKIIQQGETHPGRIFARYQKTEQRRFMGDASFWVILQELLDCSPPLLDISGERKLTLPVSLGQELSITATGREVLAGNRNWLDIIELNRWMGGVHLTPANTWCWDSNAGSIAKSD